MCLGLDARALLKQSDWCLMSIKWHVWCKGPSSYSASLSTGVRTACPLYAVVALNWIIIGTSHQGQLKSSKLWSRRLFTLLVLPGEEYVRELHALSSAVLSTDLRVVLRASAPSCSEFY